MQFQSTILSRFLIKKLKHLKFSFLLTIEVCALGSFVILCIVNGFCCPLMLISWHYTSLGFPLVPSCLHIRWAYHSCWLLSAPSSSKAAIIVSCFYQGCGVGGFFRIPTPAVLKNRLDSSWKHATPPTPQPWFLFSPTIAPPSCLLREIIEPHYDVFCLIKVLLRHKDALSGVW